MVRKVVHFALCMLFFSCRAQEPTVTLELRDIANLRQADGSEQKAVAPGQLFTIIASISGKDRTSGELAIQGLEKFRVQGQETSNKFMFMNGRLTANIQKILTVQAGNPGIYTIGPATIARGDKKISSNSLTLLVDEKAAPQQQTPTTNAHNQQPATQESTAFCKLVADKQTAVAGEPITIDFQIYARGAILEMALEPPHFENFLVKQIKNPIVKDVTVNGAPYKMQQHTFILFPQNAGTTTIAPLRLVYAIPVQRKIHHPHRGFFDDAFFDSFMGPRAVQQQAQSNGLTIKVTQLPNHHEAIDGVGTFSGFHAHLDKHEAVIGEPVTLTITLEGKSNLEQVALPKPVLPEGFRCYESKTHIEENLDSEYRGGKKIAEYIIQATKAGMMTIQPQNILVYDTTDKTFNKLSTESLALNIKQGEAQAVGQQTPSTPQPSTTPKQTEQIAQDIGFIQENFMPWAHTSLPWWLFILLLFLPPAFCYRASARNLYQKISFLRGTTRQSAKILEQAKQELKLLEHNNKVTQLHHFFIAHVAGYDTQNPEHITESDIETILRTKGWATDKISEFLDYLNTCAQFRFTTTRTTSTHECAELFKKARYWLVMLNH